jgi:hypothetical protein
MHINLFFPTFVQQLYQEKELLILIFVGKMQNISHMVVNTLYFRI